MAFSGRLQRPPPSSRSAAHAMRSPSLVFQSPLAMPCSSFRRPPCLPNPLQPPSGGCLASGRRVQHRGRRAAPLLQRCPAGRADSAHGCLEPHWPGLLPSHRPRGALPGERSGLTATAGAPARRRRCLPAGGWPPPRREPAILVCARCPSGLPAEPAVGLPSCPVCHQPAALVPLQALPGVPPCYSLLPPTCRCQPPSLSPLAFR